MNDVYKFMEAERAAQRGAIEVYRGFDIRVAPIYSNKNYEWIHPEYDGAIDAHDHRLGYCNTIKECKEEIDEILK